MTQPKSQSEKLKTILVTEDEAVTTRVCVRVITAEGFAVDIASNGNTAQSMIYRENYDLCLSDIRTPEVNV